MSEDRTTNKGLRIITFNVAKNFGHMDTLLQTCKNRFDIILFQEPSWRLIRKAPSTHNREGDDVVGAPSHPDWLTIVRSSGIRCILAHAPIGEYYLRFNIEESDLCRCGEYQTRNHLIIACRRCMYPIGGRIRYLSNLLTYLEENPWVFSFADRRAATQEGGPEDSGVG